jgi:hypothetical protein
MHAGIPALGPANMQAPGGEVDVVPAQCHQLRGPEAVAVSDQDRRGVPMPRPVPLGSFDEPFDLPVCQLLHLLRLEPRREAARFPWKQPSRLRVLLQI